MQLDNVYTNEVEQSLARKFMNSVYAWMSIGILVTGIIALFTVSSGLYHSILQNKLLFYGLILGELALVFFLSARIHQMSVSAATLSYLGYSALNGLTLSILFVVYTRSSIANVFFITSGMFAVTSFYGMVTKKDLSNWGNILFMGIIGIVIASVVNIFLKSPALYWIISYVGVVLFTALTAYDTQKIKNSYLYGNFDEVGTKKIAIMGALKLYLDFINLFIMLLRIFGKRD